jgi:hypothetical protein
MELMQAQIGDLIYDGETWGLIKEIKFKETMSYEDTCAMYVVEWYTKSESIVDWYTGSHIKSWRKQAVDSGAER